MRWAEHVARMGLKTIAYRLFVGRKEEKYSYEDQDVNRRVILRWI
jgi:hypothetical protein